jgi:hypothetical protein
VEEPHEFTVALNVRQSAGLLLSHRRRDKIVI